jgi:AcrR family transcriptional regulator
LKKIQTTTTAGPDDSSGRRSELLAVGKDLFSTRAYDELSIDDIAARAGIARGLLYYYFGSKRGFYVAVIEQAAGDLRRRVEQDASLPPRTRLVRALDAYLAYVEDSPEGYRALMAGGIGADPEVRAIVAGERRRFLARIVEGLAGDVEPAAALRIALEGWFSFIEGACLEWLDRGGLDRTGLRALLLHALAGALAAVQATDPEVPLEPARLGL